MNLPAAFGTAAFAVAVPLLAAACGVASHPAQPAGSSSPAGSPRAASMNGPGLVLVSCPSGGSVGPVSGPNTLTRVDPATGRTLATATYQSDWVSPGSYTGDCGTARRSDVRETFSPDFTKAVAQWQTGSGAVAGYVTPDGRKTAVVRVKSHETAGIVSEKLKWPRFDPRSGDLWYAELRHSGLDDVYAMYARPIAGGPAVQHGTCDNCQGFAVAWPSRHILPNGDQNGPSRGASLVTADGRTAYVPMVWGLGETSGLRPWRTGTAFGTAHDKLAGDIPHDLPCDPVDLMMTDATHALCDGLGSHGIGRLTVDAKRRKVRVRNLLPHPPGPASDPTLSPDGKRLAFLTGGGKLYVTDLHGTAPKPVATVPPGDGSAVRLLAWK